MRPVAGLNSEIEPKNRQLDILNQARNDDYADPRYGFAGVCEIEVARFYWCSILDFHHHKTPTFIVTRTVCNAFSHIAPHDLFCQTKLDICLGMKSECMGFESSCRTPETEPCCECSFADCPLESEGCALILKMCGDEKGPDGEGFNYHDAILKAEGRVPRKGRRAIRINGVAAPKPKIVEFKAGLQTQAARTLSMPSLMS
eukprot:CAMPEP_0167817946 /NCGR_PEP_ID=MMETSP0112_2-20121227/4518_1 /TAXON_ID=91324 /ORGANISM="Lotharella globosa, Strain CCCM811" /LENGTH=200 /DNA_ID=CAMNT_0007717849 /DNA_START=193 /DNA_END=795 /DNA_ORIENTATION=+